MYMLVFQPSSKMLYSIFHCTDSVLRDSPFLCHIYGKRQGTLKSDSECRGEWLSEWRMSDAFANRCRFSMSPDAFYGKRQGTLKNNSEWRTARRIDVRYSMFAAPFTIRLAVRHSPRHSPFTIRLAVRHSPRRSPFASSFAAPFAIRHSFSYSFSILR